MLIRVKQLDEYITRLNPLSMKIHLFIAWFFMEIHTCLGGLDWLPTISQKTNYMNVSVINVISGDVVFYRGLGCEILQASYAVVRRISGVLESRLWMI